MGSKRIVLTGASGYIGSRVVPLLLDDPHVEKVVGIDAAPSRLAAHPKWVFLQRDLRDPGLSAACEGADCLAHLAFVVRNLHDHARTRDMNLSGLANLLGACRSCRVPRIVFTSSISVYGYRPENPERLREDTPVNPDLGHVYSVCKARAERELQRFQDQNPFTALCILRPVLVVGPGAANSLADLFRKKRILTVRGFDPVVQALHVQDLARAIHLAVQRDQTGVFNVAPADAPTAGDVCRALGIRRVQIPRGIFLLALAILYRTGLSDLPPTSITRFLYTRSVDSSRFQQAFPWRPNYTSLEAIAEFRRAAD